MKVLYSLLVVVLIALGYLIYKDFKNDTVTAKVINIEEDVLRLNYLLMRRDSIEDNIVPNITKIEHHWHTIGSQPKIQDADSLVQSLNNTLRE